MLDQEIKEKYQGIFSKIIHAHRWHFISKIIQSSMNLISISFLGIIFFIFVNLLFNVHAMVRISFIALLFVWIMVFTLIKILPLLKEIFTPSAEQIFKISKRLGQDDREIQDAIVNFLQIYSKKGSVVSPVLQNLALEQLYYRIKDFSFAERHSEKLLKPNLRIMFSALSLVAVLLLFIPTQVEMAIKKIFIPWKSFQLPLPLKLYNGSGNLVVLKDDPVDLHGTYKGIVPDRLFLIIEQNLKLSANDKDIDKIILPVDPGNHFSYRVNHVQKSFSYYFTAEINKARFREKSVVSEIGIIEVQNRPVIRNLQVKIIPPKYSKLPPQLLAPNEGEITALKGSLIQFQIDVDKQLSEAKIALSDSTNLRLQIIGHTAKGQLYVQKNVRYTFQIEDVDGIKNSEPIEYYLYALNDAFPYAEIKQPGVDVDIHDDLILPLLIEMRDDFGFSEIRLKGSLYRQGVTGDSTDFEKKLFYEVLESGRAISETSWNLTSFYMIPDDYIQYYAEVFDNDIISGPKSFKTKKYTIRLPSLLEILDETAEQQELQLEEVKDIALESKELKEKLEEINRELKKEKELKWEQEQEIKKQVEKQKALSERLSEIQKDFADFIQKMDQSKVLSPETLEKYFDLQKMIQDIDSPELKDAMEKLNQALEKANMNQIQKAMDRLQFSLQEFEKDIDRMYELFNRVLLEQKMDELIKLAEKISQDQQQVNQKFEEGHVESEELKRMQTVEKNIEQDLEYLSDKIDDTSENYKEIMQQTSKMLENAQSYIKDQKLDEKIQDARRFMSEQRIDDVLQAGRNIKSDMEMIQNMLQAAKQNMIREQKQEITDQLQKTTQDMLNSSFEQEKLLVQTTDLHSASAQINDIAIEQASLMQGTNQLISQILEISNKTFMLSTTLNRNLVEVLSSMENSISSLENRNPRQAAAHQKKSMAGFNQALISLQNSMNRISQASSASGFQDLMQQLQQMASQQGQLNQGSMMLLQQREQGKIQLSGEDLARLAAQQEMIRRSLDDLSKRMGSRRDVLGRLDDISRDMEDVVRELEANQFNRKVVERQKRILSRLLDAQKSIREKEYSKKREAEREIVKIKKSPPELKEELLEKEDRLRKSLMESLEEGYTLEYREFIKLYFELLSRQPNILQ